VTATRDEIEALAAKEKNRPELATVPIVGWLGQNGAPLCADLFARAPHRVLAWADAWYPAWLKYPELIARVPVASAWEFNEKNRVAERAQKLSSAEGKATPPKDLRCHATTTGFPHGIESKYTFFAGFLDRAIRARMPEVTPAPGQPVALKTSDPGAGWAGDFNEISQCAAIVPALEAKGRVDPLWMPDAYAAWSWRSYHSANPDVKLTGPAERVPEEGRSMGRAGMRAGIWRNAEGGRRLLPSALTRQATTALSNATTQTASPAPLPS